MKRKILTPILAVVASLCICFGLAACNSIGAPHTHNYITKWDEEYHWEECIASGCTQKTKNKATHSYDDKNVCKECGYVKGEAITDNQDELPVAGHSYVFDSAELSYDGYSEDELKTLKTQFEQGMKGATLTFYSDGTCTSTQSGTTSKGTYEQKGTKLYVTINGQSDNLTVTPNSIIQTSTIPADAIPPFEIDTPSEKEPDKTKPNKDNDDKESQTPETDKGNSDDKESQIPEIEKGNSENATPETVNPEQRKSFNSEGSIKTIASSSDVITVTFVFIKSASVIQPSKPDKPSDGTVKCTHIGNLYHLVDSEESTCIKAGWTLDLYVCKGFDIDPNKGEIFCGKVFASMEAAQEDNFLTKVDIESAQNWSSELRSYSQPLPLADHTPVTDEAVKATCYEKGKTEGSHCGVCGAVIKEQQDIDYTDHDYTYDIKIASESSPAETYKICSVCGKLENKDISFKMKLNDDDTYTLEKVSGSELVGHIDLPYECNGKPVTVIGEKAFEGQTSFSSVTIPESITEIGYGAFDNCTELTDVKWNAVNCSAVENIFTGCTKLSSVTIGNKVETVPDYAFCTLYRLGGEYAYYPLPIASLTFEETDSLKSIGEYAFLACENLTSVSIPSCVTAIGIGAFGDCNKMEEIALPITGSEKFSPHLGYIFLTPNYRSTSNDKVPHSLKKVEINGDAIKDYAFNNCTSITSIIMGENVASIGEKAFDGCLSLRSITVANDNAVYSSQGGILYNKAKTEIVAVPRAIKGSVTLPSGITSIGEKAFRECRNLTSITIPSSVTSIGESAFYGCNKLVEVVNLSNLPIQIGSSSYGEVAENAKDLYTSASFTSKLTTLGDYEFYNDGETAYLINYNGTSTELQLPEAFNGNSYGLYQYAFYNDLQITSITVSGGVTSIGESAFNDCANLKNFAVADGNTVYSSQDGILYNKEKTEIITVPKAIDGSVTLPSGVTSIGNEAFKSCVNLTSIVIPNSVTSIGNEAFSGCKTLESITIGSGVTYIGSSAFSDTEYYSNYENWADEVLYIGNYLIKANYTISGNYSTKSGTKVIASQAFSGCENLQSISISSSVTSIGEYAFRDCSNLSQITFGAESKLSSIGSYAFESCAAIIDWGKNPTIKEIGENAFGYYEGAIIEIPSSVISIGEYAFYDCTADIKWQENPSIKEIGENAFSNYDGTSIVIPDSVISIGEHAFYCCENITSITIPENVTSIGDYAFYGCKNLESVTIGASVNEIGEYAFLYCESLTNAVFNDWFGWKVSKFDNMAYAENLELLSEPSQNAEYLRNTYSTYNWKREMQ